VEIRERLVQAQQHYKIFYDRNRREVEFQPGQWVWLHLIHRPLASLDVLGCGKLGPKFYGPFQIEEHVGDMAYKLKLPVGAKLHNVFHVGLLKKFVGEPPSTPVPLLPTRHDRACLELEEALKARLARGRWEILVKWKNRAAAESSRVELGEFQTAYPQFQLADKLLLQWERCHARRPKKQGSTAAAIEAGAAAPQ
jgi:hypothetical protein